MSAWTLWYWNGTTFSSTEGSPPTSPRTYVVAVTQPDLKDDTIIVGAAHLLYRADLGRWTQAGEDGLPDHLLLFAQHVTCYRKGLWLPTEEWRPIWRKARLAVGMKP